MEQIKYATADYTGGGIYCYQGQMTDGRWFIADDEGCVGICDADPFKAGEDVWYLDWQDEHVKWLDESEAERMHRDILRWIIENEPEGNYNAWELKERLNGRKLTIEAKNTGCAMDDVDYTMTVGELIEALSQYDKDMKVYLSFDGGWSYGGISEDDFAYSEEE